MGLPGRYTIDEGRARQLGEALARSGGVEPILRLEETDPQLHAVHRVATVDPGYALLTGVLTALVSYRLAMKGEEWWSCYGEYFSSRPPARDPGKAATLVQSFLDYCPGAAIQREQKKKRVWRAATGARQALQELARDPWRILAAGRILYEPLSRALGQEPWRKTIAFSVKIAYYAARSTLRHPLPAPGDTPIPVDLRVSCVTVSSGIAHGDPGQILARPLKAVEAWWTVARTAGIPPLNLDSLIWLVGWAPRDLPVHEARQAIAERLYPYYRAHARVIADELVRKPCQSKKPSRGMRKSHPLG